MQVVRTVALFLPALLMAQQARIDELLASEKAAERGFIGIKVVDLASGQTIYEKDADRLFIPASNAKLFTTALALTRLGPEYVFRTSIVTSKPPTAGGVIQGSLRLVGGGDPNLSGREIPYNPEGEPGDPLRALEEMADQLILKGIKRIEGQIIGDDSLYPFQPFPDGWTLDDANWDYGAPVSALMVNDGFITVSVRPGNPAELQIRPPVEYFAFDNRATVGTPAQAVRFERLPGTRQVRISGRLTAKSEGRSQRLAVDDPALYAAVALRDVLQRKGVQINGDAAVIHRTGLEPEAKGIELVSRTSPPLVEALKIASKASQNQHTELLLRAVGHAKRGSGTGAAGLLELRNFLTTVGVTRQEYSFADASGLSRRDLVSPSAIIKLLTYMYGSPLRNTWLDVLPVGGEDGTLKNRFKGTTAAGKLRAKTGSLSQVAALSGYLEKKDGRMLAFSMISNNQSGSLAARTLIDKLVLILQE